MNITFGGRVRKYEDLSLGDVFIADAKGEPKVCMMVGSERHPDIVQHVVVLFDPDGPLLTQFPDISLTDAVMEIADARIILDPLVDLKQPALESRAGVVFVSGSLGLEHPEQRHHLAVRSDKRIVFINLANGRVENHAPDADVQLVCARWTAMGSSGGAYDLILGQWPLASAP